MAITYDFIVYSSRISAKDWVLGMKALHGEVPLDIVIPDEYRSSDPEKPQVIGVLTTEGLERESTDGLELYRYLRQLNPKKNDSFGYNEVVIRNIHRRLRTLQIDEEIRVQITYSERKEAYPVFSYHMKLIGVIGNPNPPAPANPSGEIATLFSPEKSTPVQDKKDLGNSEQPVYKTTNTLEKLIVFTQSLQKELTLTRSELAILEDKVQQLEDERQQFSEIRNVIEDIFDRLEQLEPFDSRIQDLEADRHQLQYLQQTLRKFLSVLHEETRASLQDDDKTTNP